ncbi:SCP2 sterol-binding domain-containing protein [uncultured Ferrimonas sp.]|uniref:ubiquinone anaerobic biosynthesis accessory factor UbiT n=1 Tax=uncultured Ferrimonas sp. TaxID=432640 RepID=UPI00261EC65E|nr:SCP2 sterol-binding domain-containing protein [uncultured Ferrimonas sp.]
MLRPPLLLLTHTLLLPLQRHFAPMIARGELAFLQDRSIELSMRGVPWSVALTLVGEQLQLHWPDDRCQAKFGGSVKAIALMAFGQADGDALFFQRQLTMEGDTALALEVKGLLGRYPLPLNLLPLLLPKGLPPLPTLAKSFPG